MHIRKKLSKLFSIICALAMVLTLIPFNTVKAQTDSYLPKNIKTDKVLVFDLSHDLKNHDAEAKEAYMAITSIQGIVNRTSTTKIYLTHTPQEHTWTPYAADQSWLDNGLIPADKEYPSLNYGKKYPVLSYLLEHYQDQLKGIIQVPELSGTIIDGAIMAGVTAAGIEDSILVSKNIEDYILKEGYEFDVKANTRGFNDNIEAFDWAYEKYFEKCNKTFAAQHTFTAFGGGMDDQFPIMYDYYISSKVFVFCLNGNDPEELAKLQEFLVPENYTPGTAVLGLPVDEGKGISCISDQGYYFAIMYIPNLTVTSSFEYDQSSVKTPVEPTATEIDNNTNYVAFFVTDGDSMGFPTNFMYDHITTSPYRGEIPIGWSFNPHLIDLFPNLLSYYSNNNYNSFYEYVASMNNGGSPKNEKGAEVFKNRYVDYVKKANGMFRTINYFNDDEYINDLATAVNPYLLIKGYQGQTDGNETQWGTVGENITFTTISGATQGNAQSANIYNALTKIHENKEEKQPTFTIVCIGDGRHSGDPAQHVSEAVDMLKNDNLKSNFTFMRPSDLAATYKYYKGDNTVKVGQPKVVSFNNENAIDKIIVDKTSVELVEGSEAYIKGYAVDQNDQYIPQLNVTYKSLNEEIATIDNNGVIKGIKNGETIIEVSCNDKKAEVTVKVTGKTPSSISVDKEIFSTAVGGKATINAELYDQFGQILPTPNFTWESSNDEVVTVNNGLVTGVGKGEAIITVSYGEISVQVQVTVLESTASISKIIINPSYLEMYPNDIYKVTVNAYDDNNNEVFGFNPSWSVKNPDVASIDENGYIKGIKEGKTEIIASYDDKVTHSIDLIVKKDDRTIEKFTDLQGSPDQAEFEDMRFEAGFNISEQKGQIEGNAIRLDGDNGAKTVYFKEPNVLKSIKVYNPSDKVVKISLEGNIAGSISYQIEPKQTITIKTNWDKEIESFVISRSDTDVPIAFGEFVYGEADPIPTTLKIIPEDKLITIFKDDSLNLKVQLLDQNNKEMPCEYLSWSTDRDDIVKVDENGKITGVNVGSTFIYAKAYGLVSSVMVNVTESNIASIKLNPESLTIYIDDIIPLSAQAIDLNDTPVSYPATYESSNPDVVTIINNHYAKAVGEGNAKITVNISGEEATIPVYVKEHPETDKIVTFENFDNNHILQDTDIIDNRLKFENGFFKISENMPDINGKSVHFIDENTGEKAFWIQPGSILKSVKVHNPTNQPQTFIIKELNTGKPITLPNVETIIQPGETRTIYTGYKDSVEGFVFQTFWQVCAGEIVYTDTGESGFTSQDIANGITSIPQPSLGQKQIQLPKVDGFEINIVKSSFEDIISLDGQINPLGIDQEVELTIQVKNTNNADDIATTSTIKVKVLGIPADKTALQNKINEVNKLNLSIYKPSSVSNLNKAIEKAHKAIENISIRQSEVDEIVNQINDAIKQLVKKADKSILQSQINHIYQMDFNPYTPQSIENLKESINTAIHLINNEEANQVDIDAMINELNQKVSHLQKKADISQLQDMIKKLENTDLSIYTDESRVNLENAVSEAKNVMNNLNSTQEEVDKAFNNLQVSFKELELKKVETDNKDDEKNNNDKNQTPSTPQNSQITSSNTQTQNAQSQNSNTGTNKVIQTEDQSNPIIWIVLSIISISSIIVIQHKKRCKLNKTDNLK